MMQKGFNKDKLVKYWTDGSDDDFDTMNAMFECKKFNWSLFVGHLMIEKLLKALYVNRKNDYPPYIHNLLRLAENCDLDLNDEQRCFLQQ
jgi:HEPN domain-containing protein